MDIYKNGLKTKNSPLKKNSYGADGIRWISDMVLNDYHIHIPCYLHSTLKNTRLIHGTCCQEMSKAEVVPQVVRRSARQIRPPATERVWNQRTAMKTSCHTEDRSVAALSSTQTSPRARMILTPSSSRSDVLFLINKLTISFLCSASTACILPYREEIWSTSSVSRPWARGWGCWIIRWELLSSSTWRC